MMSPALHGLPPLIEGEKEAELEVVLSALEFNPHLTSAQSAVFEATWWGDTKPFSIRLSDSSPKKTAKISFPVYCTPSAFKEYLKDASTLTFSIHVESGESPSRPASSGTPHQHIRRTEWKAGELIGYCQLQDMKLNHKDQFFTKRPIFDIFNEVVGFVSVTLIFTEVEPETHSSTQRRSPVDNDLMVFSSDETEKSRSSQDKTDLTKQVVNDKESLPLSHQSEKTVGGMGASDADTTIDSIFSSDDSAMNYLKKIDPKSLVECGALKQSDLDNFMMLVRATGINPDEEDLASDKNNLDRSQPIDVTPLSPPSAKLVTEMTKRTPPTNSEEETVHGTHRSTNFMGSPPESNRKVSRSQSLKHSPNSQHIDSVKDIIYSDADTVAKNLHRFSSPTYKPARNLFQRQPESELHQSPTLNKNVANLKRSTSLANRNRQNDRNFSNAKPSSYSSLPIGMSEVKRLPLDTENNSTSSRNVKVTSPPVKDKKKIYESDEPINVLTQAYHPSNRESDFSERLPAKSVRCLNDSFLPHHPTPDKSQSPRIVSDTSPRLATGTSYKLATGTSPRLASGTSSISSTSPRLASGTSPRLASGTSSKVISGTSPGMFSPSAEYEVEDLVPSDDSTASNETYTTSTLNASSFVENNPNPGSLLVVEVGALTLKGLNLPSAYNLKGVREKSNTCFLTSLSVRCGGEVQSYTLASRQLIGDKINYSGVEVFSLSNLTHPHQLKTATFTIRVHRRVLGHKESEELCHSSVTLWQIYKLNYGNVKLCLSPCIPPLHLTPTSEMGGKHLSRNTAAYWLNKKNTSTFEGAKRSKGKMKETKSPPVSGEIEIFLKLFLNEQYIEQLKSSIIDDPEVMSSIIADNSQPQSVDIHSVSAVERTQPVGDWTEGSNSPSGTPHIEGSDRKLNPIPSVENQKRDIPTLHDPNHRSHKYVVSSSDFTPLDPSQDVNEANLYHRSNSQMSESYHSDSLKDAAREADPPVWNNDQQPVGVVSSKSQNSKTVDLKSSKVGLLSNPSKVTSSNESRVSRFINSKSSMLSNANLIRITSPIPEQEHFERTYPTNLKSSNRYPESLRSNISTRSRKTSTNENLEPTKQFNRISQKLRSTNYNLESSRSSNQNLDSSRSTNHNPESSRSVNHNPESSRSVNHNPESSRSVNHNPDSSKPTYKTLEGTKSTNNHQDSFRCNKSTSIQCNILEPSHSDHSTISTPHEEKALTLLQSDISTSEPSNSFIQTLSEKYLRQTDYMLLMHIEVTQARNLPKVKHDLYDEMVEPSAYVKASVFGSEVITAVHRNSACPQWNYATDAIVSSRELNSGSSFVVIKVHHLAASSPHPLIGCLALTPPTPFSPGQVSLCGWYPLLNLRGQVAGHIKLSLTVVESITSPPPAPSVAPPSTTAPLHSARSFDTNLSLSCIEENQSFYKDLEFSPETKKDVSLKPHQKESIVPNPFTPSENPIPTSEMIRSPSLGVHHDDVLLKSVEEPAYDCSFLVTSEEDSAFILPPPVQYGSMDTERTSNYIPKEYGSMDTERPSNYIPKEYGSMDTERPSNYIPKEYGSMDTERTSNYIPKEFEKGQIENPVKLCSYFNVEALRELSVNDDKMNRVERASSSSSIVSCLRTVDSPRTASKKVKFAKAVDENVITCNLIDLEDDQQKENLQASEAEGLNSHVLESFSWMNVLKSSEDAPCVSYIENIASSPKDAPVNKGRGRVLPKSRVAANFSGMKK